MSPPSFPQDNDFNYDVLDDTIDALNSSVDPDIEKLRHFTELRDDNLAILEEIKRLRAIDLMPPPLKRPKLDPKRKNSVSSSSNQVPLLVDPLIESAKALASLSLGNCSAFSSLNNCISITNLNPLFSYGHLFDSTNKTILSSRLALVSTEDLIKGNLLPFFNTTKENPLDFPD